MSLVHQTFFLSLLVTSSFRAIKAVVVTKTQITAIAIPEDTEPCSNSLMMKVETTNVLGGAIKDGVTSSLRPMIKVIIKPAITPLKINGRVIFIKVKILLPPKTKPALMRFSET